MQTILGSGGAIGTDLAGALKSYTSEIRLVSRHPKKVNETDQLFPADLSVPENVEKAVAGSEVCYLTVGFEYSLKVWREKWPALVRNVADACIKNKSKLVFFDNVYAIGGDNVRHITEDSPLSPGSRKGEIRAELDRHILENAEKGRLEAIIARAPDFFGPIKQTSVMMNMVYDNFARGKKAQWLCNADVIHSMGYAPELAKATAKLGNTPDAFNQVWNLPVDSKALTGREWVRLFAGEMNVAADLKVFPAWTLRAMGLFVPILRETYEMLYQYDREYYFDSAKFVKRFDYKPITNQEAVKQTVEKLKAV